MERVSAEFLLPTRGSRIWIGIGIALVVITAATISAFLPDHAQATKELPYCEKAHGAWRMVMSASIAIALIAFGSTSRAARIFLHDQTPPPRTLVFWPTRIRRGAMATLAGFAHVLIAFALVLLLVLVMGDLLFLLWPPAPGCPG